MSQIKYDPGKIQLKLSSKFEVARRYYGVLFKINEINVTARELDLIAFSALHGTLSTPPVRDEFIKQFGSSKFSVNNMTSRLQRLNILVKKDKKIKVNPIILPDFTTEPFKIEITIFNDTTGTEG